MTLKEKKLRKKEEEITFITHFLIKIENDGKCTK